MSVKAARVQQAVVGDNIAFTHTIVKPAVVGYVEGNAEVELLNGDQAVAFYQAKQPDDPTQPAVPDVQSAPVAGPGGPTCQFAIAAADSAKMLAGKSQTVRIELTRAGGAKETYYLYEEYDLLDRGFPSEATGLNLP